MAYVALIAAVAAVAYRRPLVTFDRVMYAGAVVSLDVADPLRIHDGAVAAMAPEPPFNPAPGGPDVEYVSRTLREPTAIADQVSLFRMKFGYVGAGWLLWKMGLPLVRALHLISVLSFVGLSLVVLLWTRSPVAASVMVLVPPVLNTARLITADPFATLFAVIGIYLLQQGRAPGGIGALLFSVLIRPDMAVLALVAAIALMVARSPRYGVILAVSAAAIFAGVSHWSGFYGWQTLFSHSFLHGLVHPAPQRVSVVQYLRAERLGAEMLVYSFFPVFALLAWAAWRLERTIWVPMMLVAVVVRMMLFPSGDDRFFLWFYISAACFAVASIDGVLARGAGQDGMVRLKGAAVSGR